MPRRPPGRNWPARRNFNAVLEWYPCEGSSASLGAFTASLDVPNETRTPASFTPRFTTNAILFYDSRKISARVAYNWRSEVRTNVDVINPGWVQEGLPTQRLDAAFNYTPVPFVTLSIEGTNLLRNNDRFRYALYPDLPVGLRQMARTVQASIRVRY